MYDLLRIFKEIEDMMRGRPYTSLEELANKFKCSHPTIEKAIHAHTSLSFREYKTKIFLRNAYLLKIQGLTEKEIAYELGYKWPGNYSRFKTRMDN